jgi:hypothetical protein
MGVDMKQSNLFALFFVGIFAVSLFITHPPEEPHEHVTHMITCCGSVKSTPVTYCLTDSVQVDRFGKHFESELSGEYFETQKPD